MLIQLNNRVLENIILITPIQIITEQKVRPAFSKGMIEKSSKEETIVVT